MKFCEPWVECDGVEVDDVVLSGRVPSRVLTPFRNPCFRTFTIPRFEVSCICLRRSISAANCFLSMLMSFGLLDWHMFRV
jgi:hypothetical protein